MRTTVAPQPTLISRERLSALPHESLDHLTGVDHRILWRDGSSVAGIMMVGAGASLGSHVHPRHHHHMLVVEGEALILGQEMEAGSYVHVPAGVEHDVAATATRGCTVFYLYLANDA